MHIHGLFIKTYNDLFGPIQLLKQALFENKRLRFQEKAFLFSGQSFFSLSLFFSIVTFSSPLLLLLNCFQFFFHLHFCIRLKPRHGQLFALSLSPICTICIRNDGGHQDRIQTFNKFYMFWGRKWLTLRWFDVDFDRNRDWFTGLLAFDGSRSGYLADVWTQWCEQSMFLRGFNILYTVWCANVRTTTSCSFHRHGI